MTRVADRAPGGERAPEPASARRQVLVPVGVVVAVLAILGVAAWSLTWATRTEPAVGPGQLVVGKGVAQVDAVVSAARPGMAMPGMGSDDDPVADGMRRVSVELTLLATTDEPLEFTADDFRLQVPGAEPVSPHRSLLPESVLPPGTQLSGVLVFEVPQDAAAGDFAYDGGRGTEVALPPEEGADAPHPAGPESGAPHDEGGAPHDTEGPHDPQAPSTPGAVSPSATG